MATKKVFYFFAFIFFGYNLSGQAADSANSDPFQQWGSDLNKMQANDSAQKKTLKNYDFNNAFFEQAKKYHDSIGKVILPSVIAYYKNSAEREAQIAKYDSEALSDRYNKIAFQQVIRVVSFVFLCISFAFGLVFSGLQFHMDYKRFTDARLVRPIKTKQNKVIISAPAIDTNAQASAASAQQPAVTVTDIEIGKDGVKITSSVIGLLVLAISLAFFFLFIKYLYPLQEIPESNSTPEKTANVSK